MCALFSGKYFFSKNSHPPELDDVCDTTKYIDYQKEEEKSYGLKTKGLEPIKIPNRTIMFFGGNTTMMRSSRSKSKTKTNRTKTTVNQTPKSEKKHARFDISQATPKTPEEDKKEPIVVNTTPEDPLESVSSEELHEYVYYDEEESSNEKQSTNKNDSEDNVPLDEADSEDNFTDNSYDNNQDQFASD